MFLQSVLLCKQGKFVLPINFYHFAMMNLKILRLCLIPYLEKLRSYKKNREKFKSKSAESRPLIP